MSTTTKPQVTQNMNMSTDNGTGRQTDSAETHAATARSPAAEPDRTARAQLEDDRDPVKIWLALLLASIGGFVDAVGYVVLFQTFVAHVSGDSITAAIHVGQGHWGAAWHRAFPIPWFLGGALLGTLLAEMLARRRASSIFALPLGLEVILLLLFLFLGAPVLQDNALRPASVWAFYGLTALLCMAMGLQSALLWRAVGTRVRTTFITGVLVNLAEEVVKYLFWLYDHHRPRRFTFLFRISPADPSCQRILLLLGLWLAYVLGALGGLLAEFQWALLGLALPLSGLLIACIVDLIHPLLLPTASSPDAS